MGFEAKGLGRVVLALLFACMAGWLGIAVLITLSIAGNHAARFALLAWALVAAGWVAIYGGPLREKMSWWGLALMTPVLPAIEAVVGFRKWWTR
jgi:hypothetical protein